MELPQSSGNAIKHLPFLKGTVCFSSVFKWQLLRKRCGIIRHVTGMISSVIEEYAPEIWAINGQPYLLWEDALREIHTALHVTSNHHLCFMFSWFFFYLYWSFFFQVNQNVLSKDLLWRLDRVCFFNHVKDDSVIKSMYSSWRWPGSVPHSCDGQFTTSCNSRSRDYDFLLWTM